MPAHGKREWTNTIKQTNPWTTNFLIVRMIASWNRICGIASGGGRTPSGNWAILKLVAAIAVVVIGVQTVRVPDTPVCQEYPTGLNYRGDLSKTINGHTCQAWTSQTPHGHTVTPANYPNAGLDNNYCRNPDESDTAWCYTTNPGIRWEYCAVGFLDPRCKALNDIHDVCPHMTMMSCPSITLESGETVQLILKPMQSDLDWLISNLPTDLPTPDGGRRYYCTEPACHSNPCLHGGTCKETDAGFSCLCLDRYRGERCGENVTIHSLKLLGERINEGTLTITSHSSPNTYVLIHQERWNINLSQLACQYLGFEGVFATLSGPLYNSSSVDTPAQAESVICPENATNITDCWYSETKVGRTTESESVSIVCCPVNPCNISGQPLGLESGALPDSAFSESTCYSAAFCSRFGRLNSETAWIANPSDQYQWMQVQFESSYIVTAITTQGRKLFEKWVTSYTFSSSFDNVAWTNYSNVYSGSIEIFPGNYDHDSHVTHTLARPVVGRSFRIHPKTYYGDISLRMELYGYGPLTDAIASLNLDAKFGCNPPVLGEGLGVEDGRIPDSSLTSSSRYGYGHEAYRARLNAVVGPGNDGAWVAAAADNNKWIKVDLGEDTLVTGVITQGRTESNQWVTSFQISYSSDTMMNETFALEEHCGVRKTYPGNFDADTYVTTLFPEQVTARYVRFHPVTFSRWAALRFEVLGIIT